MTDENIQERREIQKQLSYLVGKTTRHPVQVSSFGSTSNGFGEKSSDFDVCATCYQKIKFNKMKIAYFMRKSKLFSNIEVVSARVPIIKFVHQSTKIEGDLSFSNTNALNNTFLLYKYSKADDRVAPLVFSVKRFVKSCNLVGVPAYISSYAYTLMVIYFLQQLEKPVLPSLQSLHSSKKRPIKLYDGNNLWFQHDLGLMKKNWVHYKTNNQSVGELLVQFFEFYTKEFDYKKYSVCISTTTKKYINTDLQACGKFFQIRDPFERKRNLSRVLPHTNFKNIINCFEEAQKFLSTAKNINDIEKFFQLSKTMKTRLALSKLKQSALNEKKQ